MEFYSIITQVHQINKCCKLIKSATKHLFYIQKILYLTHITDTQQYSHIISYTSI